MDFTVNLLKTFRILKYREIIISLMIAIFNHCPNNNMLLNLELATFK